MDTDDFVGSMFFNSHAQKGHLSKWCQAVLDCLLPPVHSLLHLDIAAGNPT